MRILMPLLVLLAVIIGSACGKTERLVIGGAPSSATFGPCTVTVTPPVQTIPRDGGSFHVTVTGPCQWTAASDVDWITVTHGQGADVGTVTFDVEPNPGAERAGQLRIADTPVTVTQAGPECAYRVEPGAFVVSAAAAVLKATVTTDPSCTWSVSTGTPWIEIRTSTGTGPREMLFAVAEHTDTNADRDGTITIAGQVVRVVQEAVEPPPCAYVLHGPAEAVSFEGGTVSVDVSTGTHCSWSPISHDSWITPASGTHEGPGTALFVVAGNELLARTGHVTIGTATLAIQQQEAPVECGYEVSLDPPTISADGGQVRLEVSTDPRCPWSASPSVEWIEAPGVSHFGSGSVSLTVSVNDSFSPRSGRIVVGNTEVVLQQEGIATFFVPRER